MKEVQGKQVDFLHKFEFEMFVTGTCIFVSGDVNRITEHIAHKVRIFLWGTDLMLNINQMQPFELPSVAGKQLC